MFLSALLSDEGFSPESIKTEATVTLEVLDNGPKSTKIHLICDAKVPEVKEDKFQALVQKAKDNCPISKALQGVESIKVSATLTA